MENKRFNEIFPDASSVSTEMLSLGFDTLFPEDFSWKVFYSLISGRHALDEVSVRGDDESSLARWKTRFCSILWQYGPSWWKQAQLQDQFRKFSEEDLVKGSLQVASQALNPAKKPDKTIQGIDLPIVETINAQSSNQYKKNKTDAYSSLLFLLKNDVTEPFLRRFDPLFKTILRNSPCEDCAYDG